jgi:hypothetical protein
MRVDERVPRTGVIARKLPLGILPAATGIGLVVYIVAGLALPLAILLAWMIGAAAVVFVRRRLPADRRQEIGRQVRVGLLAGLLATASYDLIRLVIVSAVPMSFWPFDIFTKFGRLLVGVHASPVLAGIVGTIYHYANGIGFGVAYTLLFKRHGVRTGLVWAAVLEAFMVSLYPGWLHLKALDEFVSISIIGHVTYGVVLGVVAQRAVKETSHV